MPHLFLEMGYIILFVLSPILLLALLWQNKYISSRRYLGCVIGIVIAVGVASSVVIFGRCFVACSELFFIMNLPLSFLVRVVLRVPSPSWQLTLDILVPFIVYPFLGLMVGRALDLRAGRKPRVTSDI
jgi:hypothetical protein